MNRNGKTYRIAMPVLSMEGFKSEVSGHFGKAPGFMVVNSDGGALVHFVSDDVRVAGECAPIQAIVAAGAEVVVAHSMGRGALQRCQAHGLRIMEASGRTVLDVLNALRMENCPEFTERSLCDHHDAHHADGDMCH